MRMPHPSVTRVVRQRIETKRHRPELFRPAVVEKSGAPSRHGTTIGGSRFDPRSRIEGRSMDRPARIAPSDRPDRLHPRSTPDIQRHRVAPPASSRQMKPVPPRPERFQGKSSNLRRTAPEATEKPSRKDAMRPGPVRQRPMVSLQPRQAGPSPSVIQRQPGIAESQPRPRIQRPEAPSQRGQAAVSQARPHIFPAPGQPRMQKPAVSSAPRRQPVTSLQRQPAAPARSGRPEQARVLKAPPPPKMQAPAVSSPPRQRPSASSQPRQIVPPRRQPDQRPVVSSPAPQQQVQRPFPSRRHTGGRPLHRDFGGPR